MRKGMKGSEEGARRLTGESIESWSVRRRIDPARPDFRGLHECFLLFRRGARRCASTLDRSKPCPKCPTCSAKLCVSSMLTNISACLPWEVVTRFGLGAMCRSSDEKTFIGACVT